MEEVLELKHICYAYHTLEGETPTLTDISFALKKGEFVAIVGHVRLRQIHPPVHHRRPPVPGAGADQDQREISEGKHHQRRLYAAARRTV